MMEAPPGWNPIHYAPTEIDLCLCIEDTFGLYSLPFPCRKKSADWVTAKGAPLRISPLGWRLWTKRHRALPV